MTVRVLFIGEGPSDSGIVPQIETLAARLDIFVAITDPDLSRLRKPPGRAVAEKLSAALAVGGGYDLIVVHRDADRDGRDARLREIAAAVQATTPDSRYAAVIPVRMTEAWLLTNEQELRYVAGNPRGTMQLGLPKPARVETIPDPKKILREILGIASGLSGRRLARFNDRFSQHRRQLLERLDPDGGIGVVSSWQCFVADLQSALKSAAREPS